MVVMLMRSMCKGLFGCCYCCCSGKCILALNLNQGNLIGYTISIQLVKNIPKSYTKSKKPSGGQTTITLNIFCYNYHITSLLCYML